MSTKKVRQDREDQVPHVGLVGLEIQAFAAGLADRLAHVQVVVDLSLDAGNLSCRRLRASTRRLSQLWHDDGALCVQP